MMPDEKIQSSPLGGSQWPKPPWYERREVRVEILLFVLLVLACAGVMYFFMYYLPGHLPRLEN